MKAQYDSMTQYNLAIVECWSPRIVIITEISAFLRVQQWKSAYGHLRSIFQT